MSSKSIKVKNFIKDTGSKNQLFVFAGYNPNPTISDSNETSINVWNYSDFSVRIGQNSVLPVVPYVKWTRSKPYRPWSSTVPNTGNFYAYNDQNGYVYLCISDNNRNRTDHSGRTVSTIRPSHTSGIQKYDDGYTWKPLYKITPSIERFVSSTWLPVVSFELYDSTQQVTQLKLTQTFCGNFDTGEVGQCGIYAKLPLNTDDNAGTVEYGVGDLFTIANNITCSDCHYLMYNDEKFTSVFYGASETVPTSITVLDNYDLVGSLIQQNQISQSSPYYYLYDINQNDNIDEGAVISAFIDLSGFSLSQLKVNVQNPEFTITSNTGVGARIRLITEMYQGSYVISGIEVLESGSYYKDISLSLSSSAVNIDTSLLINAISINIDTIDGLGFDPVDILNTQHAMIDARVEKKTIEESGISIPNKLNFFGLVQNPSSTVSGNDITSGSNKNKKQDIIYRTTVAAKIGNNSSVAALPTSEETYEIPLSNTAASDPNITNTTTTNALIGGYTVLSGATGASFNARAEIKNINYAKANYILGSTIKQLNVENPKEQNTINQILEVPEFVQYTGKVLSSKKLTNDLNLTDVDSVIIRINMVEGM